jgi:hypothetical protein
VLCGVPNDTRMIVSVTVNGHTTGNLDFLLDGQLLVRHDLMVTRSDSASATLAGTVRDAKGRAAAQALVFVPGSALRTMSDATGRYALERVPAGTRALEVRRAGHWPATVNVDVPGKGTRTVDLTLGPGGDAPPSSAPMDSTDPTGYADRSGAGIGTFLSARTIATEPTASLADLLTQLYPLAAAGKSRLSLNLGENAMTRLIKMIPNGGATCTPNYFLNGVPWLATLRGRAQMEIESTIDTRLIRGIEVYEPRAIPPQFDRRNRCGSVVIWVGGGPK